jgi:hypothetical protein
MHASHMREYDDSARLVAHLVVLHVFEVTHFAVAHHEVPFLDSTDIHTHTHTKKTVSWSKQYGRRTRSARLYTHGCRQEVPWMERLRGICSF